MVPYQHKLATLALDLLHQEKKKSPQTEFTHWRGKIKNHRKQIHATLGRWRSCYCPALGYVVPATQCDLHGICHANHHRQSGSAGTQWFPSCFALGTWPSATQKFRRRARGFAGPFARERFSWAVLRGWTWSRQWHPTEEFGPDKMTAAIKPWQWRYPTDIFEPTPKCSLTRITRKLTMTMNCNSWFLDSLKHQFQLQCKWLQELTHHFYSTAKLSSAGCQSGDIQPPNAVQWTDTIVLKMKMWNLSLSL